MCGSQKGLMTPPGLAIVAASEKAQAAHKTAGMRTLYWDWSFRDGPEHYQKYCGTPPMHTVFGLRKAMEILLTEGLENAWRRHALLAEATRRAVEKWSEGQVLAFNVTTPAERSNSVTNVVMQGRDGPGIHRRRNARIAGAAQHLFDQKDIGLLVVDDQAGGVQNIG